jgi:hypothetical protein
MDTETLTISEAAARAGVSRKTIQRGIGAGKYAGAVCVELPNGTKQWRIPTAAVPAGVSRVLGTDTGALSVRAVPVDNVGGDTSQVLGRLLDTIDRLTGELIDARERAARAESVALQLQAPRDGLLTKLRRTLS